MSYPNETTARTLAPPPAAERPLERITTAAERAEVISNKLSEFLVRAQGEPPMADKGENVAAGGYVNQLDRLHYALTTVEQQLVSLHQLG